jgi:protein-S-isoprenylcysteine O-methyltransferase Ste14
MTEKQTKTVGSTPLMRVFVVLIAIAGAFLVFYSVFMVATHQDDMNRIVLDLIMFGFGFAAIWFGLTHFDIQKTETRIQTINQKADRIKEILDRKQ